MYIHRKFVMCKPRSRSHSRTYLPTYLPTYQEAKELQNEYEDDEPDEDEKNSAVLGTIMPMVLGTLSPSPLVRVNSTTKWTAI